MTRPDTTKAYLEIGFNVHGGTNLYLLIQAFWDDIQKQWKAFIKTPKTQCIIQARGKNGCELKNAFIRQIDAIFITGDEFAKEVFSMFQPLSYWDEMGEFEE